MKSLCAGSPELGAGSIKSLQLIKSEENWNIEKCEKVKSWKILKKKCAEGQGFSKHSAASEKCCWLLVSTS